MNLSARSSAILVQAAVAAGTGTITPAAGVFVPPGQAVWFLAVFGTVSPTSVTGFQVQASNDDAVLDPYSAIGGSNVVVPVGAGGLVWIDVTRPVLSWVLPVVTRVTANAVLSAILAVVYEQTQQPPALDVTVLASKLLAAGAPRGAA